MNKYILVFIYITIFSISDKSNKSSIYNYVIKLEDDSRFFYISW